MWAVEKDPALRSDFCNLTLLDRAPDDKRLAATVERALDAIPRLGQRVVSAPARLVPPGFAPDPTLDLDYHVRRASLPAPGTMRSLLDACATAAEAPLDRSRPLWEFTLFEGLAGGGAALLQKVHHTISDGVGGLRLSLALLDLEPDPAAIDTEPSTGPAVPVRTGPTSPTDVVRAAMADAARRNARAVRTVATGAGRVVTHPAELPSRVAEAARVAASLRRQTLLADGARSDILAGRSLRRRFETFVLSLPRVRETARRLGGSVNDVYVTGLAAALGRYHARFESDVTELRMAMPVSTRGRGTGAANQFVPARVLVPIAPADDPQSLFASVHERLGTAKAEAVLPIADALAGLVSSLPTSLLVLLTRSQTRTIDFAASNLRGSPVPLYLAGARIEANYPFGPRTGSALNVTMLGYCDDLHVGCNVDPAAVGDIPALLDDLDAAFEDLLGR